MGRGKPEKENPLNQLGGGVHSKGEGGSWHSEDCFIEQGFGWVSGYEDLPLKKIYWKKVIGVKYGQEGCGWRTNEARGIFGVGVWKEASWCWDNIEFKVGRGTKVKFWTDHWCGNVALSQNFPQLYTMAVFRNAMVNEVWDSSLGQGGWNLKLSRDSNDWELDLIEELLLLLRDFRISSEEDSVLRKGEGLDIFRIRDAYNLLAAHNPLVFPKKSI